MLERLYVDNYKCLVNFELPLQELTLLLGANDAGKTSLEVSSYCPPVHADWSNRLG